MHFHETPGLDGHTAETSGSGVWGWVCLGLVEGSAGGPEVCGTAMALGQCLVQRLSIGKHTHNILTHQSHFVPGLHKPKRIYMGDVLISYTVFCFF
jgi:hypothetical protein